MGWIPGQRLRERPTNFRQFSYRRVGTVAFRSLGAGAMFRAEGGDISFIYFSEISLRILGYFSKFLCPNQNIFAPAARQV